MALALAWSKSTIAAVGRSVLIFDYILHHVGYDCAEVLINFKRCSFVTCFFSTNSAVYSI